jgi:phage protein D
MTPACRIEVNGNDAGAALVRRLVSVTMTDEAGVKADTCEIMVDARGNVDVPPIGTEIKLWLGYEPAPIFRGRFRVTGWTIEGMPRRLIVGAHAADLTGALRAPKMRSHHDMTVGEIVKKIAGEHGLTPLIDAEIGARKIEHIDQQTESDMSFLTRLANRNGATFKVGAGRLVLAKQGSAKLPDGSAKQVVTLKPSDCSRWSVGSQERGAFKSVVCCYMDHGAGKRVAVRAGEGEPAHRDRRLYGSKVEAQAAADAQLGQRTRGAKTGEIDGPGMPALYAEALVKLDGFDPDVDGDYLAQTVTHTFDGSGYETSVILVGADADQQ